MRILIVEDEARLAKLISRVLGEEEYAVETTLDGRTALTCALSEPLDLPIVDWMLPDLDGVQVIKRLRAAEMNVPVLTLIARTQVEVRAPEKLPARGDAARTEQSLAVLLDNAFSHAPRRRQHHGGSHLQGGRGGHSSRAPDPHLRAFLPGRQGQKPRQRRHRPRPLHRPRAIGKPHRHKRRRQRSAVPPRASRRMTRGPMETAFGDDLAGE